MTESLALVPRSLDELELLSKRLAESTLIPAAMRANMPNVLVTIMTGQELGIAPMAALRGINVIEGKPSLGADMMVAIVLGSGKAEYFDCVEESDLSVTYETKRRSSPRIRRRTWTIEQAKKAGLHLKDNWRGYARDMLAARAKSSLARDVYPDVLAGCYTPDEIDSGATFDMPITAHADVIDAEVVSETMAEVPAWADDIDACKTEEALKALAPRLAEYGFPKGSPMHKHYGARLAWVRQNPPVVVVAAEEVNENGEIVQKPAPAPAAETAA